MESATILARTAVSADSTGGISTKASKAMKSRTDFKLGHYRGFGFVDAKAADDYVAGDQNENAFKMGRIDPPVCRVAGCVRR